MPRPSTSSNSSRKEKQPPTIQERLEPYHAYILPVFGVIAALVGPWLLVGLLYLVVELLGA